MNNRYKTFVVLGFALVDVLATAFVSQPTEALSYYEEVSAPTPITPTITQTPSTFEFQVIELERRFDHLESLVEVQSNVYDATVHRMESNLNLLLAIIAVASLLAVVLGLGIARVWIRLLVQEQLRDITSQEISRLVQEEVSRLREDLEPKFTQLYDEYERALRRSQS